MSVVVSVEGLSVGFWRGRPRTLVPVVRDVSLTIHTGDIVCLLGQSGSGKSVTALSLLGMVPWEPGILSGRVVYEMNGERISLYEGIEAGRGDLLDGRAPRSARRWRRQVEERASRVRGKLAHYVFQNAQTSLNPFWTVGAILERHLRRGGRAGPDVLREAARGLERVGLPPDTAGQYPFELSGGSAKRVTIACAAAAEPPLVIADEPTTGVDPRLRLEILALFRELCRPPRATLLISHGVGLFQDLVSHICVMYAGQIVEAGPRGDVLGPGGPRHPYTRSLLLAELGVRERSAPVALAVEAGCAYRPSCAVCATLPDALQRRCREPQPPLAVDQSLVRCWWAAEHGPSEGGIA